VIAVTIMIAVAIFVVPHLVAVPVCSVAITVSVAVASNLPVLVPAVIPVMIVAYDPLISRRTVVAISLPEAVVVAIAEARLIGAPPLPIFPLPLTAQPVVLDVIVVPLGQPLPVSIVVIGAPIIGSFIVRTRAVSVLGASGKGQRSQDES
jgi:hypothetical protein